MQWRERIHGFYSILDAHDEALARLLVRPVAQGGAGAPVLQVRIKRAAPVPTAEILAAARMARAVTAEAGALLIVNDRLDIALAVDADGVHLGQDDLPLADARAAALRLHRDRPLLIGVSTHNREQVCAAVCGGADYIGFGPVYATTTKMNPDPVQGIAGLRDAVAHACGLPVVAIGGITPERITEIAATGAAAACLIGAVNRAENPALAGSGVGAVFVRPGA